MKRLTLVPNDAAPREPQGTRVHGFHLHQGLCHPLPLQGLLQPRPRRDVVHRISAEEAVPVLVEWGRPSTGWQPLRYAERRLHGAIEDNHNHTPPNTSK